MSPAANTVLALILTSLGGIAVILSFLVPDKKKASISFGIGIVIVVVGIFQCCSQMIMRYQFNQRVRQIQDERKINLDELRQKLKENSTGNAAPASPKKP